MFTNHCKNHVFGSMFQIHFYRRLQTQPILQTFTDECHFYRRVCKSLQTFTDVYRFFTDGTFLQTFYKRLQTFTDVYRRHLYRREHFRDVYKRFTDDKFYRRGRIKPLWPSLWLDMGAGTGTGEQEWEFRLGEPAGARWNS